jgi:hypothetical protein
MASEASSARGWFVSEGWRWLVATILIPLAGFGWDRLQERQMQREQQLDAARAAQQQAFEDRRNQSELVIKLLPALAAEPGTSQRNVALAVLSDLAQRGAGGDSLFAAVNLAVQETDRRVRSGQASDGERAALTQLAVARDEGIRSDAATGVAAAVAAASTAAAASESVQAIQRDAAAPARSFAIATPRLYVHVFDDSQLPEADKLRAAYATERRWLTPPAENVVQTALARRSPAPAGSAATRVVYFHADDAARAQTVVDWLRANGQPGTVAQASKLAAPQGQIEVWFPGRA